MPTVNRAYEENYKICFFNKNKQPIVLYTKDVIGQTENEEINFIDLEKETIDIASKDLFIQCVLYGTNSLNKLGLAKKKEITDKFQNNFKITFTDDGIYGIIDSGETFVEHLGEYYQEIETDDSSWKNPDVPETNKVKKRVITYIQK